MTDEPQGTAKEAARGAVILPFPARLAEPPSGDTPSLRLERAMRQLAASLEGLRASMAGYRAAISDLGGAMEGLSNTASRYQESLRRLDDRVADLRTQTRQLEPSAKRESATSKMQ